MTTELKVGETYTGDEIARHLGGEDGLNERLYALGNDREVVVAQDEGNDNYKILRTVGIAGSEPTSLGLWVADLEVRDGEHEYTDHQYFRGVKTEKQAMRYAERCARNFFGEPAEKLKGKDNVRGWYEDPFGYRLVRLAGLKRIDTLAELLNALYIEEIKNS